MRPYYWLLWSWTESLLHECVWPITQFQNGVILSNIFNIGLYRGLLAKRVIRHVKDAITITACVTDGLASMPEVIIRLGCFASRRLSNLRLKFKDDAKSYVWKYFGQSMDDSGKVVNGDHVYCSICFDKGVLKGYKNSISTSNHAGHLRGAHSIL